MAIIGRSGMSLFSGSVIASGWVDSCDEYDSVMVMTIMLAVMVMRM